MLRSVLRRKKLSSGRLHGADEPTANLRLFCQRIAPVCYTCSLVYGEVPELDYLTAPHAFQRAEIRRVTGRDRIVCCWDR